MSVLSEAQQAIADAVAAAVDQVRAVYPSPRATHETMTILVNPAGNWGNINPEAATFCAEPELSWEIVLIAGTTDYSASWEWLNLRLIEVFSAFDDDPTLGGKVSGALIAGWTGPRIVAAGPTTEALSLSVQLLPMTVVGFPT